MAISFTITGPPRTKKNSGVLDLRGRKPKKLPSKAYQEWNASAQLQLAKVRSESPAWSFPFQKQINVQAVFYRHADVGDAVGFYQALADTLQEARIVVNDGLIVSWDYSRLKKDSKAPRIEVTITVAVE